MNLWIRGGAAGVYTHGGVAESLIKSKKIDVLQKVLDIGRQNKVIAGIDEKVLETVKKLHAEVDAIVSSGNPRSPGLFAIFLVAANAEANRSPFDIPEGESEIVAGYFLEYSAGQTGLAGCP